MTFRINLEACFNYTKVPELPVTCHLYVISKLQMVLYVENLFLYRTHKISPKFLCSKEVEPPSKWVSGLFLYPWSPLYERKYKAAEKFLVLLDMLHSSWQNFQS